MATQIRYNQPVSLWGRFEDQVPIRAYSAAAVQKDQRLAFSANLVVHLDIVDRLSMPEESMVFPFGLLLKGTRASHFPVFVRVKPSNLRPWADSSMSLSSRLSLVSSFLAHTTHQKAIFRYPAG